jgi:hypothetical protein
MSPERASAAGPTSIPERAEDSRQATIVVTGDVTIDWNLARTKAKGTEGTYWSSGSSTRAYWQRGGAALLADLITAAASGNVRQWEVRQTGAPTQPICPEDLPYHHSYAVWSNRAASGEPPVWRVVEFLGSNRAGPSRVSVTIPLTTA